MLFILEGFWQHLIDIERPCEARIVTNSEYNFQNFRVNLEIFLTDLCTILLNYVATYVFALFNSPLEKSAKSFSNKGGGRVKGRLLKADVLVENWVP